MINFLDDLHFEDTKLINQLLGFPNISLAGHAKMAKANALVYVNACKG
jgi:hypothetical protein